MSSPFVAEIRMFGFNYAPRTWAFCNGQSLPLSQNVALYSLLGITYGGDGRTNFQLPNLQGAFPIQAGQASGLSAYNLGQTGGTPTVTLTTAQTPAHTHGVNAQAAVGTSSTPSSTALAQLPLRSQFVYGPDSSTAPMAASALGGVGNGQAHNNMPPFLAVNYCIALQGVFPPRP